MRFSCSVSRSTRPRCENAKLPLMVANIEEMRRVAVWNRGEDTSEIAKRYCGRGVQESQVRGSAVDPSVELPQTISHVAEIQLTAIILFPEGLRWLNLGANSNGSCGDLDKCVCTWLRSSIMCSFAINERGGRATARSLADRLPFLAGFAWKRQGPAAAARAARPSGCGRKESIDSD